jgi:hypothetical protein
MDSLIGIVGNFAVVIGLLIIAMYVLKGLVPTPYRLTQRALKRLGTFLMLSQAKRRGWFFAILVHAMAILSASLLVIGVFAMAHEPIIAALLCGVLAFGAKRILDSLRKLRSRRRALPGWWR